MFVKRWMLIRVKIISEFNYCKHAPVYWRTADRREIVLLAVSVTLDP